jgi:hypothetical protein
MVNIAIKPVQGRDEYVFWSTEFGNFLGCGNRTEILEMVAEEQATRVGEEPVESRIHRCDLLGSSARRVWGFGHWEYDTLVYEQRGLLPRHHWYAAAVAQCQGRHEDVWDLLEPLEDRMDVRRG